MRSPKPHTVDVLAPLLRVKLKCRRLKAEVEGWSVLTSWC